MQITAFDIQKAVTFSKLFSIIELSPSARLVLRCLIDHWNTEKMFCYPSQETISEETGVSIRSVKTAIQELRKASLILTEMKNSLNYTFTGKFFELINIAPSQGRNCTLPRAEIAPKQINKKIINKPFRDFKNKTNPSGFPNCSKEPDYLEHREVGLIVMNAYNRYNVKTEQDKTIIKAIQTKWNFSINEAPIVEFLPSQNRQQAS